MSLDADGERRQYVLDACADVAVTLLFLGSEVGFSIFDKHVRSQAEITKLTIGAFQIGFAVAVVSHVCRILWHRTFVGLWCRKLGGWYRNRKNLIDPNDGDDGPPLPGGGGPLRPSDPRVRHEPQATRPDPLIRSAGRAPHAVLIHPAPGHAIDRATDSARLGLLAAAVALVVRSAGQLTVGWVAAYIAVLVAILLRRFLRTVAFYQVEDARFSQITDSQARGVTRDEDITLSHLREWLARATPTGVEPPQAWAAAGRTGAHSTLFREAFEDPDVLVEIRSVGSKFATSVTSSEPRGERFVMLIIGTTSRLDQTVRIVPLSDAHPRATFWTPCPANVAVLEFTTDLPEMTLQSTFATVISASVRSADGPTQRSWEDIQRRYAGSPVRWRAALARAIEEGLA